MQIYLHISEKSCNFARFYVLKNEVENENENENEVESQKSKTINNK